MYLPRLRRISDAIKEIKTVDPDSVLTRYFIEELIHRNQLTAMKYGDAWLINLDELFLLFSATPPDESDLAQDQMEQERNILTSGEIYRAFLQNDKNTIVRKPNLRRFILQEKLPYYIVNNKWLINFPAFTSAVNPKNLRHHIPQPRLRGHDDSIFDFKRLHPHLAVSLRIITNALESGEVFYIRNGKRWIINYDELEIAVLKAVNELPENNYLKHYQAKYRQKADYYHTPVKQKEKGRYTLLFKITVLEYMQKHHLTYEETVIHFWNTESRKIIRARITLLMQWERLYNEGGKRALIEQERKYIKKPPKH